MAKVKELAKYVKSKNAGPFWGTLEVYFDTKENYDKVKNSKNITPKKVAELYHVDKKNVKTFYLENLKVIKFSFPRNMPQGHKYENDMHFGQQYILLAETEI